MVQRMSAGRRSLSAIGAQLRLVVCELLVRHILVH